MRTFNIHYKCRETGTTGVMTTQQIDRSFAFDWFFDCHPTKTLITIVEV